MGNDYINDFTDSVKIYHNELKKYDILKSQEEEFELLRKAKSNDIESRNKILEAHLRLVVNLAKKYNGKGIPMGDFISEGNIGLIRAIEKLDLSRNVRFSVCAYWWIESAMIEFCKKQTKKQQNEIPEDEIMNQNHKENPIYDEYDDVILKKETFFSDDINEHTKDMKYQQWNTIVKLLNTLTDREKYIIQCYFGIENERMTLDEIGETLSLSKERVRQCKKVALRKLRSEIMSSDDEIIQIFSR